MEIFKKSLVMFVFVVFHVNHAAERKDLVLDDSEMDFASDRNSLDDLGMLAKLYELNNSMNSVDMTQVDQQEYTPIKVDLVMEMMTNAVENQKFVYSSVSNYYTLQCPYCDYLVGFYGKSKLTAQIKEEKNCRHKILNHCEIAHLNSLLMKVFHQQSNQDDPVAGSQLQIAVANDGDADLMGQIDDDMDENKEGEDLMSNFMDFDYDDLVENDEASAQSDNMYDPSRSQSGFEDKGSGDDVAHKDKKKKKPSTHTVAEPIRENYQTDKEFEDRWAAWRRARDKNNAQVQKSRAKPIIEDFDGNEDAFKVAFEKWKQRKKSAAEQKKKRKQQNKLKKNR